jgi:hypothetical protein
MKIIPMKISVTCVCTLLLAGVVAAQSTQTPDAAAPAAPPAKPMLTIPVGDSSDFEAGDLNQDG